MIRESVGNQLQMLVRFGLVYCV